MRLPESVIQQVKQLAEEIPYGRITIFLNGDSPVIPVTAERQFRHSAHDPAPGVIVAEDQQRQG
jgi:hypothetical protein